MSDSTPEITVDELATALAHGATVVDIRETSEYMDAAMTDLLTDAGLDAYSVAGSISGWARSGRDVVTGPAPGA